MKRLNQIVKVLIVIAILSHISLINSNVLATDVNRVSGESNMGEKSNYSDIIMIADNDLQGILSAGGSWIEEGKNNSSGVSGMDVLDFVDKFSGIGQILVAVGTVALVIIGGVMAIQWITATPEKQAKLKTQLIGLVISAVVIYGAIGIWNFVRELGKKTEEELQNGIPNTTVVKNTTEDT